MRYRSSLSIGIFLLAAAVSGQVEPGPASESGTAVSEERRLEVVYLANEGFLLRSGDRAVLIDAFVTQPYSGYSAVPGEVFQRMLDGEPPFEEVQLALASHVHRDHFQPRAAGRFLECHPETLFASSAEVIETLRRGYDRIAEIEDQLRVVLPEPERSRILDHEGIRVEFLRLSHGSERFAAIQNLGHLIHLGDKKVLHVGDAEMRLSNFEPYDLASRDLDLALVPYWYYPDHTGNRLVREHFSAGHEIACHVDTRELENVVTSYERELPGVKVFKEAMDSVEY